MKVAELLKLLKYVDPADDVIIWVTDEDGERETRNISHAEVLDGTFHITTDNT